MTSQRSPLCAEFYEIVARLEALPLTPLEQTILYGQINDMEDRLASIKRLDEQVHARMRKEPRDSESPRSD